MTYKFTNRAKKAIEIANDVAIELGHNYIGTEHILYGLAKEGSGVASKVLENQAINAQKIENEIIKNLKVITNTVIEQERQARKLLTKDIIDLEDEIYRSYGIFTNARKISYDESINLLSNIKLGVDLGILDNITDMQVQKLYLYIKPANLQKYLGEKFERIDRDIKRAEVIKQIIENK